MSNYTKYLFLAFAALSFLLLPEGQTQTAHRSPALRDTAVDIAYLLDSFPGASAAYSLRVLSSDYIDAPIIRSRRSSDNAEADFTAAQINDGALASWAGSGNAFVRTFYDQSGHNRHAIQTTNGNQKQIVSAGVLVTLNGKPATQAGGDAAPGFYPVSIPGPTLSIFYCGTFGVGAEGTILDASIYYEARLGASQYRSNANNPLNFGSDINYGQMSTIASGTSNPRSVRAWRNGLPSGDNPNSLNALGSVNFIYTWGTPRRLFSGKAHELILYNSDQSAQRAGIESNIMVAWGMQ